MPLYEYKCDNCGEVFELIQKFSDEPVKVHEKCGGPVHKLISRSALQFKGTGWYITDYAKPGSSGSAGGSKSDHSHSEGGKSGGEGSKDSSGPAAASSSSGDSGSKSESKPESSKPAPAPSDK